MFTQSIKDMCVSNTGGRQAFSQAFACNCTVTQSFHNYNLLFIGVLNKLFLCCFFKENGMPVCPWHQAH